MKYKIMTLFVMCLFLFVMGVMALGNGRFSLPWWAVDGGGETSQSDTFMISGTIGQPDAGRASSSSFVLTGGFWAEIPPQPLPISTMVYLPVIVVGTP